MKKEKESIKLYGFFVMPKIFASSPGFNINTTINVFNLQNYIQPVQNELNITPLNWNQLVITIDNLSNYIAGFNNYINNNALNHIVDGGFFPPPALANCMDNLLKICNDTIQKLQKEDTSYDNLRNKIYKICWYIASSWRTVRTFTGHNANVQVTNYAKGFATVLLNLHKQLAERKNEKDQTIPCLPASQPDRKAYFEIFRYLLEFVNDNHSILNPNINPNPNNQVTGDDIDRKRLFIQTFLQEIHDQGGSDKRLLKDIFGSIDSSKRRLYIRNLIEKYRPDKSASKEIRDTYLKLTQTIFENCALYSPAYQEDKLREMEVANTLTTSYDGKKKLTLNLTIEEYLALLKVKSKTSGKASAMHEMFQGDTNIQIQKAILNKDNKDDTTVAVGMNLLQKMLAKAGLVPVLNKKKAKDHGGKKGKSIELEEEYPFLKIDNFSGVITSSDNFLKDCPEEYIPKTSFHQSSPQRCVNRFLLASLGMRNYVTKGLKDMVNYGKNDNDISFCLFEKDDTSKNQVIQPISIAVCNKKWIEENIPQINGRPIGKKSFKIVDTNNNETELKTIRLDSASTKGADKIIPKKLLYGLLMHLDYMQAIDNPQKDNEIMQAIFDNRDNIRQQIKEIKKEFTDYKIKQFFPWINELDECLTGDHFIMKLASYMLKHHQLVDQDINYLQHFFLSYKNQQIAWKTYGIDPNSYFKTNLKVWPFFRDPKGQEKKDFDYTLNRLGKIQKNIETSVEAMIKYRSEINKNKGEVPDVYFYNNEIVNQLEEISDIADENYKLCDIFEYDVTRIKNNRFISQQRLYEIETNYRKLLTDCINDVKNQLQSIAKDCLVEIKILQQQKNNQAKLFKKRYLSLTQKIDEKIMALSKKEAFSMGDVKNILELSYDIKAFYEEIKKEKIVKKLSLYERKNKFNEVKEELQKEFEDAKKEISENPKIDKKVKEDVLEEMEQLISSMKANFKTYDKYLENNKGYDDNSIFMENINSIKKGWSEKLREAMNAVDSYAQTNINNIIDNTAVEKIYEIGLKYNDELSKKTKLADKNDPSSAEVVMENGKIPTEIMSENANNYFNNIKSNEDVGWFYDTKNKILAMSIPSAGGVTTMIVLLTGAVLPPVIIGSVVILSAGCIMAYRKSDKEEEVEKERLRDKVNIEQDTFLGKDYNNEVQQYKEVQNNLPVNNQTPEQNLDNQNQQRQNNASTPL